MADQPTFNERVQQQLRDRRARQSPALSPRQREQREQRAAREAEERRAQEQKEQR